MGKTAQRSKRPHRQTDLAWAALSYRQAVLSAPRVVRKQAQNARPQICNGTPFYPSIAWGWAAYTQKILFRHQKNGSGWLYGVVQYRTPLGLTMNNKNKISLPMLLAVASNAANLTYPSGRLLREAMFVLGLRRGQLARLLEVKPGTLDAWLAPRNSRTVPNQALRRVYGLLLGCAAAIEAATAKESRLGHKAHLGTGGAGTASPVPTWLAPLAFGEGSSL